MLFGKTVSLVIPCKNEEKAIARLLRRVPKYIDEVVVVDNNSSDKTMVVAKKLGAKVFCEKQHVNGIGYGYAHRLGMKEATGDLIITMDGDGTYPLAEIKQVVAWMERQKLDMVSCNRFPLHNPSVISKMRQLGVWILNTEVRVLYGYPMQDILSGMWVVNAKAVRRLKLKRGGWNLSPEIKLAALTHKNVRFGEYHISHHYRQSGASKQQIWQTGLEHFLYILGRRVLIDSPVPALVKSFKLNNAQLFLLSFE